MLGMAILVPLILQEPLPAISGESFGPAVSGKLDSTPRPDVFPDAPRNVQPDIRQSVRPEALPQDVPTGEERGEQANAAASSERSHDHVGGGNAPGIRANRGIFCSC